MKVTSFSTAALVLLAVSIMALWPEHRPGPAPRRALAQEPNVPAPKPTGAGSNSKPAVPEARGLEAKLALRMTADFDDTPLKDVLTFLAEQADVQMFINRRALEDEGLTADTPVSMHLRDVRLDLLLDLLLEQAGAGGLTYVERDNILVVSTVANLDGAGEVRVYNCQDLLALDSPGKDKGARGAAAPPGGAPAVAPAGAAVPGAAFGGEGGIGPGSVAGGFGGMGGGAPVPLTEAERKAESLKNLIRTAVKPGSWSEEGGLGTISEYNGLIVINHTPKVHQKVEEVLKMLREAAGLEPGKTAKVHRP